VLQALTSPMPGLTTFEKAMAARPEPTVPSADARERSLFASALSRATSPTGQTPQARARDAAEQLVATSLVAPVLKSLRESDGAAAPFAPSQGERSFRQMQDTVLAQRLVKSSNWTLVDQVARRLLKNATTPKEASA